MRDGRSTRSRIRQPGQRSTTTDYASQRRSRRTRSPATIRESANAGSDDRHVRPDKTDRTRGSLRARMHHPPSPIACHGHPANPPTERPSRDVRPRNSWPWMAASWPSWNRDRTARVPTKNPASLRGFPCRLGNDGSGGLHLVSLQAFRPLDDIEGDLLAFLQGLEAGAGDRAEMHEHVFTIFAADETKALGIVEPFHGAGLTLRHS